MRLPYPAKSQEALARLSAFGNDKERAARRYPRHGSIIDGTTLLPFHPDPNIPSTLSTTKKPIRVVASRWEERRLWKTSDGLPQTAQRITLTKMRDPSDQGFTERIFKAVKKTLSRSTTPEEILEVMTKRFIRVGIDPGRRTLLAFSGEGFDYNNEPILLTASIAAAPFNQLSRRRAQANSHELNLFSSSTETMESIRAGKTVISAVKMSRPWTERAFEAQREERRMKGKGVDEVRALFGPGVWREGEGSEVGEDAMEGEGDPRNAEQGRKEDDFHKRAYDDEIGLSHILSTTPRPIIMAIGDAATSFAGKKGGSGVYRGNTILQELSRRSAGDRIRFQQPAMMEVVPEGLTTKSCIDKSCVTENRRSV